MFLVICQGKIIGVRESSKVGVEWIITEKGVVEVEIVEVK